VRPGRIVGAASVGAREISTFPYIGHESSTVYRYLLRAVGGGGVEESTTHQTRRLEFDTDGVWVGPRPNPPVGLMVDLLSGGRFCLRWSYEPAGQEVSPGSFSIYNDVGSAGTIDYGLPVGSVGFAVGRRLFEWTSGSFADGVRVWWAVRSSSPDGVFEDNTVSLAAEADVTGPPVHTSVFGIRTEDVP
jgi:hypothetical protein